MSHHLDILGRTLPRISDSIQDFNDYVVAEKSRHGGSEAQYLLQTAPDYATLSLRIDPATVCVEEREDFTQITVDSANFPGILVEVVQHLTELNLEFKSARVSSDGTFFLDVFEVQEVEGGPVRCPRKLHSIHRMLHITYSDESITANGDDTDDVRLVETTVFELCGRDEPGLLGRVTEQLMLQGCDVRSAAVWTYAARVALVLSVTTQGCPITDERTLRVLRMMLHEVMSGDGRGTVLSRKVKGEVHHDRRLHRIMLAEAARDYDQTVSDGTPYSASKPCPCPSAAICGRGSTLPPFTHLSDSAGSVHSGLAKAAWQDEAGQDTLCRSSKYSRPDVEVTDSGRSQYWTVTIACKNRPKLLFDTLCTLCDSGYEVFHATVDTLPDNAAFQEFYVRPRGAFTVFHAAAAAKLRAMLEASVQRRFPMGLKIHVHSVDKYGCLANFTRLLRDADLSVTRAKVKTFAVNSSSGHTLYVVNSDGSLPSNAAVEEACSCVGGRLVDSRAEIASRSGSESSSFTDSVAPSFNFSIFNRKLEQHWQGSLSDTEARLRSASL